MAHAVRRDEWPVQQRHAVQVGERDAAQVGVDRVREAGEEVDVLEQEALSRGHVWPAVLCFFGQTCDL